jgi:general secretion pathway protein I
MHHSVDSRPAEVGFTLVEALVALVIVSLGMMAVFTQLNQYALGSIYVEQKTLASWIATNKLAELSIQPEWPETGDEEDDLEFAGREWHYRIVISETDVPNLRRADVSVSFTADPDNVLQTVSGLIEPPPPRGYVPVYWLTTGGGEG